LYLHSWVTLNDRLNELNEDNLKELLRMEMAGQKRATFVSRIHAMYSRKRTQRERQGYLAECDAAKKELTRMKLIAKHGRKELLRRDRVAAMLNRQAVMKEGV
jgi:hypothetical protein